MFAHSIEARRQTKQPGVQNYFRAHAGPRQTALPGNCAAHGSWRRTGAEMREQYLAARSAARPDIRDRAAKLRLARRDRGKSERRLPGNPKWRTDSAPPHQQHLQGHHVAGRKRQRGERLNSRQDTEREITDKINSAAPATHLEYRAPDCESTTRILRARVGASKAYDD